MLAKISFMINLVVVYFLMNFVAYIVSNKMIFLPPSLGYTDEQDIVKLITSDGKKISTIFLYNKNAKYTIIYSHGNAVDIGYMNKFLQKYHLNNYSILSYDYHGYGTSEGCPTEENTYKDIKAAYDYLTINKQIDPSSIILIGNSVGSGPTLELATKEKVGGVVLESAFVTAFRVLTRLPLFFVDKYRNNQKIKKLTVPVLFIYGNKDKTVSPWHSKSLYKLASSPKKIVEVDGADHNNLYKVMGKNYWEELENFSRSL